MFKAFTRLATATAIVLVPFFPVALLADECPAERALYSLDTEDGRLELGFARAQNYASIASNLYLYLTTTQRTYWFTFSVSNGYSGMTLLPVTDPTRADAKPDGPQELIDLSSNDEAMHDVLRALRFYALDEDFTFWFEPPCPANLHRPMSWCPKLAWRCGMARAT